MATLKSQTSTCNPTSPRQTRRCKPSWQRRTRRCKWLSRTAKWKAAGFAEITSPGFLIFLGEVSRRVASKAYYACRRTIILWMHGKGGKDGKVSKISHAGCQQIRRVHKAPLLFQFANVQTHSSMLLPD